MFRLFYFTSYFTSERVLSLGKPGAVILPQTQHALYRRHYYCFMNVCREDTVSIKELKFFLLQTSCHYSRLIQRAAKRYHREEVRSRKQIILIDVEGKNLGTMKMAIAVQLADSEGLELVVLKESKKGKETPVYQLMSKKAIYDNNKKERKMNKKDPRNVTKEIKLNTGFASHDIEVKIDKIRSILEKKNSAEIWIQPKLRPHQWEVDELRAIEQKKQVELLDFITKSLGITSHSKSYNGKDLVAIFRPNIK